MNETGPVLVVGSTPFAKALKRKDRTYLPGLPHEAMKPIACEVVAGHVAIVSMRGNNLDFSTHPFSKESVVLGHAGAQINQPA